MRGTLYQFHSASFLVPQFHIESDERESFVDAHRRRHEELGGAPVTVEKVATAIVRRGREARAVRYLARIAERRMSAAEGGGW